MEKVVGKWWQLGMQAFTHQVDEHCHECGVPMRGYGELSQTPDEEGVERCSVTHQGIYKPKRKDRKVEVVTDLIQLETGRIGKVTHYLQNGAL